MSDRSATAKYAVASDITQCVCDKGYYSNRLDGIVNSTGDCKSCTFGMACNSVGLTIPNLPVKAGYWRASNTSDAVERCNDYDAPEDKGSGCIGGSDGPACKDSLDGPFCVLCKDGPGHYYNADDHECRVCDANNKYGTIF